MVAAEVGSRRVGAPGVIDVRCQQVSDAARHSLAADTDDAFPEFPPPAARDPLRVSEVFNRAAGVYTAQEKTKGVARAPQARSPAEAVRVQCIRARHRCANGLWAVPEADVRARLRIYLPCMTGTRAR